MQRADAPENPAAYLFIVAETWAFAYSRHNAWSLPLTIVIILVGGTGGMLGGMLGSAWIVVQLSSLRKRKRDDDSKQASDL
jgi:hypothetical protein